MDIISATAAVKVVIDIIRKFFPRIDGSYVHLLALILSCLYGTFLWNATHDLNKVVNESFAVFAGSSGVNQLTKVGKK